MVTVVVGQDPGSERVEVDPVLLARHSPVFRAMLEGGWAVQPRLLLPDCDPRAWEVLLALLQGGQPGPALTSVPTALGLLYLGKKYMVCINIFCSSTI